MLYLHLVVIHGTFNDRPDAEEAPEWIQSEKRKTQKRPTDSASMRHQCEDAPNLAADMRRAT